MCTACRNAAKGDTNDVTIGRVHSLADFSSSLIDAFMESDGAAVALVFVDNDNDAYEVVNVFYDAGRNCIVVKVVAPYADINSPDMRKKIAEVNES